jgi:tRNA(Ile2) C34 agmatinyltransferase TiaS
MAFHEQHERHCPRCGNRMAATARKCLNCGRYVEEDEDDEEAESGSS